MLAGELPLGRFPAPSQRAAVNARIDEIVLRTLEKERELRQQSAEEVKTELTQAGNLPAPEFRDSAPAGSWLREISKVALIAGPVLFGAAVILTAGSTQGVLLTLAVSLFALGAVGMMFGKRPRTSQPPAVPGPPAKVTVRSVAFFVGGIVACVVGVWIFNGGVLATVMAKVSNIADDMGVPVQSPSAALTIGTLVIAVGAISSVIGYMGMWYALWQMRHGHIATAWRRVLRVLVLVPVGACAANCLIIAIRSAIVAHERTEAAQMEALRQDIEADAAKKRALAARPARAGLAPWPIEEAKPQSAERVPDSMKVTTLVREISFQLQQ